MSDDDVKKLWGAMSSFQQQLYHVIGTMESIQSEFQFLRGLLGEMVEGLK